MFKSVIKIFKNDIKLIFNKLKTLILIIGIIILPSAYAWPNILSAWDPYSHTGNIKIAVVNEDLGVRVKDKDLNIGNNIITNLRKNKSLNWNFLNSKIEAENDVKKGDYYASIVIPKNFSENLTSIRTNDIKKAEIYYTVNEKINAISPKITNSGASAVVNNINKNFVETANGIIFEKLHELGINIENNLPQIEKIKNTLFNLNDNFTNYEKTLTEVIVKLENGKLLIESANKILPEINLATQKGILIADKTNNFAYNIENFNASLLPTINNHLIKISYLSKEFNEVVDYINKNPKNTAEIKDKINILNARMDNITPRIVSVKDILEYFNELSGVDIFNKQLNSVNNLLSTFNAIQSYNNKILNLTTIYSENGEEILTNFINKNAKFNEEISNLKISLESDITPKIKNILKKSNQYANKSKDIFTKLEAEIPTINEKLMQSNNKINDIHLKLLDIQKKVPKTKNKLEEITSKIKNVEKEVDINNVLKILHTDYKKQSEFFANPVELKANKLYHIKNYGSAMTPFYTSLAIWVGALLLSSLVTTKISNLQNEYKKFEIYLGRGLLFLTISLLQTLIICLGNIYFLGIQTENKLIFILFSLLISLTFCAIIYTIVSVFGNVGKAICIILLVIQMGASGSTFPIQMTSEFFQFLYPKIPFTYAVSLLREAVGGVYNEVVYKDIKILILYFVFTIILGVVVKLIAEKIPQKKEEEKSELFL